MAIIKGYAFYDKKLGAFMLPFWQPNDAVAKRAGKYALNNQGSELYPIRQDLELYRVAEFDDETGESKSTVECIAAMGVLVDGE